MAEQTSRSPEPKGERIPGGTWERILPSLLSFLSRAFPVLASLFRAFSVSASILPVRLRVFGLALLLGAASPILAGPGAGEFAGRGARNALAPVERYLRSFSPCDSFVIRWNLTPPLLREAGACDSLRAEWTPPEPSNGVLVPDRIAAVLTGRKAGRVVRLLVSGETLCFRPVARTARAVRLGERLAPEDLVRGAEYVSPSFSPPPDSLLTCEVAGRTLPKGSLVARSDLVPPLWVRRGERLRLTYRGEGLVVEGTATAREDGRRGDLVSIRLLGGDRDCEGMVVAPGEVEIGGRNRGEP